MGPWHIIATTICTSNRLSAQLRQRKNIHPDDIFHPFMHTVSITPDLSFLNIYNPFTNERISVYLDKYSRMSLNTKEYFVKQISHQRIPVGAHPANAKSKKYSLSRPPPLPLTNFTPTHPLRSNPGSGTKLATCLRAWLYVHLVENH